MQLAMHFAALSPAFWCI